MKVINLSVPHGGITKPAVFLRYVKKGERIRDLINEAKATTWEFAAEVAVLTLDSGSRVLVRGGLSGIEFFRDGDYLFIELEGSRVRFTRIIAHTHPAPTGPSDEDRQCIGLLRQRRSYIFELGGDPKGTRFSP